MRKALEAEPDTLEIYSEMAQELVRRDKGLGAVLLLEEVLRAAPAHAPSHHALASCLLRRNRTEKAVNHLREALRLEPDRAARMCNLAWILATTPDPTIRDAAEAVRLAEKARAIEETTVQTLDTLAAAYAAADRFDDALSAARQGAKMARQAGQDERARLLEEKAALYETRRAQIPAAND